MQVQSAPQTHERVKKGFYVGRQVSSARIIQTEPWIRRHPVFRHMYDPPCINFCKNVLRQDVSDPGSMEHSYWNEAGLIERNLSSNFDLDLLAVLLNRHRKKRSIRQTNANEAVMEQMRKAMGIPCFSKYPKEPTTAYRCDRHSNTAIMLLGPEVSLAKHFMSKQYDVLSRNCGAVGSHPFKRKQADRWPAC